MNTEKNLDPVASLDALYDELVAQAHALKESYFQAALALCEGEKGHIPVAINVRTTSQNAVSIYWVKIIIPKSKAADGKRTIRTINKGRGSKYEVGAFSFVKQPLKQLVRDYEDRLSKVRAACSENRKLRRSVEAHVREIERTKALVARVASR